MPLSPQRFARFSCFYSKKLKSMSLEETQISRCLYHILWTYVNSFEILHTLGMAKRRIHFSMLFFLKLGYTLWADFVLTRPHEAPKLRMSSLCFHWVGSYSFNFTDKSDAGGVYWNEILRSHSAVDERMLWHINWKQLSTFRRILMPLS